MRRFLYYVFFFNDTATTEIYTLSLHDALPILDEVANQGVDRVHRPAPRAGHLADLGALRDAAFLTDHPAEAVEFAAEDRKSTRLNSSHANISYAVFCLKKKKN